jgi:hypothetical protein
VKPDHQALGEPQVRLAGLKLWVHGYQYRDGGDVDDANWLNATAICSENGASVTVSGAFIRTDEMHAWQRAVEALAGSLAGTARLACMEPELAVTLAARPLGAVDMEVRITPDPLTQEHRFTFAIDQSYLAPLASQCAHVLEMFPVRGA